MLLFKLTPEMKHNILFITLVISVTLLFFGLFFYIELIGDIYNQFSQSCELFGDTVSCNVVQFRR